MQVTGLPFISNWQNFYVIIGTASATVTGLMFVVTTLIAGIEKREATLTAGVSAFITPTIVHFCTVLLITMVLSAPWPIFSAVTIILVLLGLLSLAYLIPVTRRMRVMPEYQTPLKDWLWYIIFPAITYIALITAAILLLTSPQLALYLISAVMAALLFIGIHNAWDLVIFLALERSHFKEIRKK